MVKNVLFSDANHGGLVLLEEYCKYTHNNLFFYDVYDKLSENEKNDLSSRLNVSFLSLDDVLACEDSFIKINPVHMPPLFGTDFTHHEFVSYLLDKKGFDKDIIGVTGVKGKSSVVWMIANFLSDFNVVVLSSDGLFFNDEVLVDSLSITPASIISAVNLLEERGLVDRIDYCIFEVSLGMIPHVSVGVLTNIIEDYPICSASSSASIAKKSIFESCSVLCDYNAYMNYYSKEDNVTCVSLFDSDADIYTSNLELNFDKTCFKLHYNDVEYDLSCFALTDFYVNNLLFAFGVILLLGVDIQSIFSKINQMILPRGRGTCEMIGKNLVIEDINPGLNTSSIRKCIDNVCSIDNDYILILGGDYGITCEEIDEEKLVDYLRKLNKENIVYCGDLGKSIRKDMGNSGLFFESLDEAIGICFDENSDRTIQIVYRSDYNRNKDYLEEINEKFH